jgi:hypothetical protein
MSQLLLAQEIIPPKESDDIEQTIALMRDFLEKKYAMGHTLRHFHPKMHGCVKAIFTVPETLPEDLQIGLFKKPRSYDAWIRFSNAPPHIRSDKKASGRGMAIKILGVEGTILDADPLGVPTQNFLMTTSPVLSPGHVANYKQAIYAITRGFPYNVPYFLHPGNWRRIGLTLKFMQKHTNLLEVPYFTGSPFLFGSETAVKFCARPTKEPNSKKPEKASDHFLRDRLIADLENDGASFDFLVQPQNDPVKEPIEDTSRQWHTPFIKVATIHIPPQDFMHAERISFGENLFFSPWQCLRDHRPLGGINRARRRVYSELATYRRNRNSLVKPE